MARAIINSTLGLAQPRVLHFAFNIDVQAFSTPDWLLRLAVDTGRTHVSAYTCDFLPQLSLACHPIAFIFYTITHLIQPTSNLLVSDLGAIMYHAMFSKRRSRIPASNCAPEINNGLFAMLSLKIHQSRAGVVLT
jgi:hypothetical protein